MHSGGNGGNCGEGVEETGCSNGEFATDIWYTPSFKAALIVQIREHSEKVFSTTTLARERSQSLSGERFRSHLPPRPVAFV